MESWPHDRWEVAGLVLKARWVIAAVWLAGSVWLFWSMAPGSH